MPLRDNNCSLCGKQFSRSDALMTHVKRLHNEQFSELYKPKQTPFKCSVCDSYFSRKDTLKLHVKNSHKNSFQQLYPNKIFHCSHCEKDFNSDRGLKFHFKADHTDASLSYASSKNTKKNNYKVCGICKKDVFEEKFGKEEKMIQHLENVHNIVMHSKDLLFPSVSEFNNWKVTVEEENRTSYKKGTTKSSKKSCVHQIYLQQIGIL